MQRVRIHVVSPTSVHGGCGTDWSYPISVIVNCSQRQARPGVAKIGSAAGLMPEPPSFQPFSPCNSWIDQGVLANESPPLVAGRQLS